MTYLLRVAPALLGLSLLASSSAEARAQDPDTVRQTIPRFTAAQIDSLVAPVALYPDPVLAQVLVAATFADQIEEAAAYVRASGTRGIDDQGWDVSVKSIAHYPTVLNRLAEDPDWTTALGQAYALQSSDVMEGVQRMRALAQAQGNLPSTREQDVVIRGGNIIIEPAESTLVYVPTYDPGYVYYEPLFYGGYYDAAYWSFGAGFPIGPWLAYDCDWYGRRVFHHGWKGGGWLGRYRPFMALNGTSAQSGSGGVNINREVLNRPRYSKGSVNRTVFWDQTRNGPIVHRGGRTEIGGTSGTGGGTIFPQDIRRDRAAATSDYRGVVRPSAKGSGVVIYRGPARGSAGTRAAGYRSAQLSGRPAAGTKAPSGATQARPMYYGGSVSRPSKPASPPAASRPSAPSRGFGTITPSRPSGRKP